LGRTVRSLQRATQSVATVLRRSRPCQPLGIAQLHRARGLGTGAASSLVGSHRVCYDPATMAEIPLKEIEERWQRRWERERVFEPAEDDPRPHFYCIEMLP